MTSRLIRQFDAYIPRAELIDRVVAPPVSSITSDRYQQLVADNPDSILHLLGSAIDTGEGGADPSLYDMRGAARLQEMIDDGTLEHHEPAFYILSIATADRTHVGIVCEVDAAGVDDGRIKRHEHTRQDTEDLVARHLDIVGAHTDPVAMTYRSDPDITAAVRSIVSAREPIRQFVADDGSTQTLWAVTAAADDAALERLMATIPAIYVTDGHHRTAATARLRRQRAAGDSGHTGREAYCYLPTVLFAEEELELHGFNRAILDLAGDEPTAVLKAISDIATVEELAVAYAEEARPATPGAVAMILGGRWYRVTFREADIPSDPRGALDAVLLQNLILGPVLGITDVRADHRLHYVPGPAGLAELEHSAPAIGFGLHAASVADVMAVADAGEVMPPKSTWFSPKVKTGLIVRQI